MSTRSGAARRFLGRVWRALGIAEHYSGFAWRWFLRTGRLCLRPVLSLRREVLVLDNPDGFSAGLFAEFGAVLGMLEHYEVWRAQYAGAVVDFKGGGLYHDPAAGQNWWEYYFEPIDIGDGRGKSAKSAARRIDIYQHIQFSMRATRGMSRAGGHRLIERYIRVKPEIRRKVDAFVTENFGDAHVIGVHFRGTDKAAEAPRVAYETVLAAIRAQPGATGAQGCRVFVATDEQAFLDWMRTQLPDELIYSGAFRSPAGHPAHIGSPDRHTRGEEAVIDCLLLSRCQYLIRTPSNLGLCATFFNPSLPTTLLTSP